MSRGRRMESEIVPGTIDLWVVLGRPHNGEAFVHVVTCTSYDEFWKFVQEQEEEGPGRKSPPSASPSSAPSRRAPSTSSTSATADNCPATTLDTIAYAGVDCTYRAGVSCLSPALTSSSLLGAPIPGAGCPPPSVRGSVFSLDT